MKIESRVPEITRKTHVSVSEGNATGRPRSVTSGPIDNSTGRADAAAIATSGKRMRATTMHSSQGIDMKVAVEKLNKIMKSHRTDVSFSVDEEAHATVIKFFKTETGELIKQFPPEEILAMKAKINKSVGLLHDSKA